MEAFENRGRGGAVQPKPPADIHSMAIAGLGTEAPSKPSRKAAKAKAADKRQRLYLTVDADFYEGISHAARAQRKTISNFVVDETEKRIGEILERVAARWQKKGKVAGADPSPDASDAA